MDGLIWIACVGICLSLIVEAYRYGLLKELALGFVVLGILSTLLLFFDPSTKKILEDEKKRDQYR